MDRGAWWVTVQRVTKIGHDLATNNNIIIRWNRSQDPNGKDEAWGITSRTLKTRGKGWRAIGKEKKGNRWKACGPS